MTASLESLIKTQAFFFFAIRYQTLEQLAYVGHYFLRFVSAKVENFQFNLAIILMGSFLQSL